MQKNSEATPTTDNALQVQSLFSKFDEILHTKCSPTIGKLYAEYTELQERHSEYEATIFYKLKFLGKKDCTIKDCTKIGERFHSEIIAEILRSKQYLHAFIDILNTSIQDNHLKIDKANYTKHSVHTEFHIKSRNKDGFIDILIKSTNSKHEIIIENKITGKAEDQWNQLPRYYEGRTDKGALVDAVVYLVLDDGRVPDKSKWVNKNQYNKVLLEDLEKKLLVLPAKSKNNEATLLNLSKCKPFSPNNNKDRIRYSSIIQYEQLVEMLSKEKIMDDKLTKKIYSALKNSKVPVQDMNTFREQLNESLNSGEFVKLRLEEILNVLKKSGNEASENFSIDGKSLCSCVKFNVKNRKTPIKLDIGIEFVGSGTFSYLRIWKEQANVPGDIKPFIDSTLQSFLDNTEMIYDDNDKYYWQWVTHESKSTLKEANAQIIKYTKNTLLKSVLELKTLPEFEGFGE